MVLDHIFRLRSSGFVQRGPTSVQRLDKSLLLALFSLLGIGLVQVYSSSFIFATESRGDGLFFFKRQLFFVVVSVILMLGTALAPWKLIERYGYLLWIFAFCGVLATFVPHLGIRAGGAARWLNLPGGFVFEPSELLRVSVSLAFATVLTRRQEFLGNWEWLARILFFAIPMMFVLKQPDFGSFSICFLVLSSLLFAFGLPWAVIIAGVSAAVPAFYFIVMTSPYRKARVMAFLDPWADPGKKGFQAIQSMLSFGSGHLTGSGLGEGQGKLFFLPEAHTDFTLAVLGEEIGFIGFLVLISIYGFVVLRGLQIAARIEDRFAKSMVLGLSLTFAYSVFVNVGVVMGMLPTKGLTLPFLSYGGSSLLMTCFMFGLILNAEANDRQTLPTGVRGARTLTKNKSR